MRLKYSIFISLFFVMLLASCSSEDNTNTSGIGWLKFKAEPSVIEEVPPSVAFTLSLSTIDGVYSHTWDNIHDFSSLESFHVGEYVAKVVSGEKNAEGYDCQCYYGEVNAIVEEGQVSSYDIDCTLQQSLFKATLGDGILSVYPKAEVCVHTEGYGYNKFDVSDPRPLLAMPGSTIFIVSLTNSEGKEISVSPNFNVSTMAAERYDFSADLIDNTLISQCGSEKSIFPITPELFDSNGPEIVPSGFEPATTLILNEGYTSATPVKMTVEAETGLKKVALTMNGSKDAFSSFEGEFDLFDPPYALVKRGLKCEIVAANKMEIDFTNLLANLSVTRNANFTFIVEATDNLGRVSKPMTLSVEIRSLNIGDYCHTGALVGINIATLTFGIDVDAVETEDFSVFILDEFGNIRKETPIIDSQIDKEAKTISLSFSVDKGVNTVPIRLYYMGHAEIETKIERIVPEYSLVVEPFATTAYLIVHADDPAITEAITEYALVTANGVEAGIMERDPENGVIRVSGLHPSTRTVITPVVIEGGYAPSVTVTTEAAEQVPTGDFEEADVLFTYPHLPQGGIYSTSAFPLYNMQNFSNISVSWTQKHWASVNDKTFCKSAKNHNTWYMQPSAQLDYDIFAEGNKSMRISSVGWSTQGEDIQPYMQEVGQYLPYNNNVPFVSHRSAGKLFLGSYEFNPSDLTEAYYEGLPFSSRPSSLNGYYKYTPDASAPYDKGLVIIELINEADPSPTVVASATMRLSPTPDFIAFNLPLKYNSINLKVHKLKIMFASSYNCGTIEEEDQAVPATADVPNAAYIGSILWVDNLSFAY